MTATPAEAACPECGQTAPQASQEQTIDGGPFSADPAMREVVRVFRCECGTNFARSELQPLRK
jgi:hypothetical protein